MSTQFIPNFIRRTMEYRPNDILTAQEYNAILNLLITQGDYNSEWLEYLQTEAIPEAIQDLSAEAIAAAISQAVQEEIASLTASVSNKTSAQLNNPAITILNIGTQYDGIADLKALLDTKNLYATYAVATNLIGANPAYPTIAQLTALKTAGNDIVAYGTDGSPLTPGTAATVAAAAEAFLSANGFDTDTFIFPSGNSDPDVITAVSEKFKYGVNALFNLIVDPSLYPSTAGRAFYNIPIIPWDDTVDVDDIKEYIDNVVENTEYMILQINTDASSYDETKFGQIADYILTKSSMLYPRSIKDEMNLIQNTINNRLAILEGIYVTEENGETYLNW